MLAPVLDGLIYGLTGARSPSKSIQWPLQADHSQPVFAGNARWVSDDCNCIAYSQSLSSHAGIIQLGSAAPLHSPALRDSLLIRRLDVDEGVGVPKYELHELAIEFDFLGDVISR